MIKSGRFDLEHGCLSFWLTLDYGGAGQGFGGYVLYAPEGWRAHGSPVNYAGHFLWRVFEIAGVSDVAQLPGRTIRVKAEHSHVHAIGHIRERRLV